MKNKKVNGRLVAALALGVLAVSGFAVAVSAMDNRDVSLSDQSRSIGQIKNNPLDFIKAGKWELPGNFDYVEQMNWEFVDRFDPNKDVSYSAGDALKSLEEKDSQEK
jgi:hypothetical protein